ncbi:MAG: copper homeostasis protein CutC [Chitinophagaceae bacterium]|nr:copper homeostasis protein CutC [Chitinophagaceae bacterium]
MVLEIAAFNISSALKAAASGADRIELCENIGEGGTTPSYGSLQLARRKISIPVFPMIRPRGGDFIYSDEEFAVMKSDINVCKLLGFEGIVFGILNNNGTIDIKRTSILVEMAYPMEVTIHRAFDRTADPFLALEDIINCGCQRILTSGHVPNADDGKKLIKQLIDKADDRIIIMPGSGVRSNNILQLAEYTGALEMHSSAKKIIPSDSKFKHAGMNEILSAVSVDEDEVRKMKAIVAASKMNEVSM